MDVIIYVATVIWDCPLQSDSGHPFQEALNVHLANVHYDF